MVQGKTGSVIVKLMPAPKGKGLIIEKEAAKVLELAGIRNVWSKTYGQTKNKINFIKALEQALQRLSTTKAMEKHYSSLSILDGGAKKADGTPDAQPAPASAPPERKRSGQRRQPRKRAGR
jgi:hypothetical protein